MMKNLFAREGTAHVMAWPGQPGFSWRKWASAGLGFTLVGQALSLACMYVSLSPPVAMPMYSNLVFYPDRTNHDVTSLLKQIEEKVHAKQEDVFFKSKDGKLLHGWFFQMPGKSRTFLVSHGNGGNIAHRLNLTVTLLLMGGSVLLYDYQGYGKSEGTASLQNIVDDGMAAYDFLHITKKIPGKDIVAYGESLGCSVTGQIAAQKELAGVILQSGFASIREIGRDKLCWLNFYPEWSFPQPHLNNIEVFSRPHAPLLLFHGMQDPVITPRHAQDIYNAAVEPKTLVMMPLSNHNDVVDSDLGLMLKSMKTFLGSLEQSTSSNLTQNQPQVVAQ